MYASRWPISRCRRARRARPDAGGPPRRSRAWDLLERTLALQHDLARHHGLWHRTSIPDLLIAETALHNDLGVVHVDAHYHRIAEVRPLTARRLR